MPSQTLANPITFGSIPDLLAAMLNIVIVISIPFVVFFIIYAGFMYVTAQGNPEKLKAANTALLYSVIGGVIIVGSVAIVQIVKNLAQAF